MRKWVSNLTRGKCPGSAFLVDLLSASIWIRLWSEYKQDHIHPPNNHFLDLKLAVYYSGQEKADETKNVRKDPLSTHKDTSALTQTCVFAQRHGHPYTRQRQEILELWWLILEGSKYRRIEWKYREFLPCFLGYNEYFLAAHFLTALQHRGK